MRGAGEALKRLGEWQSWVLWGLGPWHRDQEALGMVLVTVEQGWAGLRPGDRSG